MKPGRNIPAKFSQRELEDLDGLVRAVGAKSRSAAIRVAVAFTLAKADGDRRVRDQLAELVSLDSDT